MPREKSRYREKRSSSYSSESSYERKKSKSKHKRRSRSRDRSESSTRKRRRSTSRSRHRRRSYSRSLSRDRYEKSRRRSQSRSRSKRTRRSVSRERRSVSRSSSRSKKYSKGKHKSHRRSRSASSRSSSVEIEKPVLNRNFTMDDTESKLEKAIKAAAAAGLTMTKIPTYEYKEIEVKEEMPTIHDRNLLAELNSDSFVQKSFTSTKNKKKQNIVIDLNTDTVKLPDAELKVDNDDSIINFDALPSEEELVEMWIKKLYQYRKKMLKGEI